MALNKFFRFPFAVTGDKSAVPDDTQLSGDVSFEQGYGPDYARDPATDPLAKNIERDKMNQLLFDITTALREYQIMGTPDFITSAQNGGTAYSYDQNAIVKYSGVLYISLVSSNTALPNDATKWALLPTPALLQQSAYTSANAGGVVDAITASFTPAITALPSAPGTISVLVRAGAANATTAPTFAPDGLTAKTIVKGNNQPLVAGDIAGAGHWLDLQYDATLDKWVLQNPATGIRQVSTDASIQGAFKNLTASATGLSANVSVAADEIAVEDASNNYKTLRAVSLTLAGTSVGANGLDAGTIAASTWYSLWVIWNGTTTAGLMSLSATAPTLPAGYTHKARVGWIRTDGTGNKYPLAFRQYGRRVMYAPASGANITALPLIASGAQGSTTTPTWVAAAHANFIPSTAGVIGVLLAGSAVNITMIAPNSNYGSYNQSVNPCMFSYYANPQFWFAIESPNIFYAAGAAGCSAAVVGWEDNI